MANNPIKRLAISAMAAAAGMAYSTLFGPLNGLSVRRMVIWIQTCPLKVQRLARLLWIVDCTQEMAASGCLWIMGFATDESLDSSIYRGRLSKQGYNVTLKRHPAHIPGFSVLKHRSFPLVAGLRIGDRGGQRFLVSINCPLFERQISLQERRQNYKRGSQSERLGPKTLKYQFSRKKSCP